MWGKLIRKADCVSPIDAAIYGAVAGCTGTVVITFLGRLAVAVKAASGRTPKRPQHLPSDPFNPQEVSLWQDRYRSPAAYAASGASTSAAVVARGHAAAVTPAGALTESKGPGPEGAAQQFLVKLGSGLFDSDFARYAKPAGKILHFVYGSVAGIVYGMLQGKRRRDVWRSGTGFGMCVWAFGPALLVPAMRLMLPPWQAPKLQTGLMIAGHIVYGLTVAKTFDAQARGSR